MPIDEIRALPAGEQPWSTALTFRGGRMHGQTRTVPMLSTTEGLLPFSSYDHGRPVTHRYRSIGWLPERLSWAYDLLPPAATA